MRRHTKRPYRRNEQSRHRVIAVWKDGFDEKEFARALLLLAQHLDETGQEAHNKGQQASQANNNGGGHHE